MPASAPVLAFRGVTKAYALAGGATHEALRGVSVDVPPGRAVALIGRSGSGKSTFLHLAAGIDAPTRGEVRLLGQDLAALADRARTLLRREHVGLVFQFFHLLPHLSVEENVLVPALVAGDPPRAASARARGLLARVGLEARARDPVQKLSGGEMQRVALCRALLRRPKLLLADEPTGNLDEENGQRVMELLLGVAREEGSAVLYVTHSRELAALGDAIWTLHSGARAEAAARP
jgi:ABC-type lipoprotein export system ATPase subunit